MFQFVQSPYLAAFDGGFQLESCPTTPPTGVPKKKKLKKALAQSVERLSRRQEVFAADRRYSLLLVFQALNAGGKDSTIRAVLTGVDPTGICVTSFKKPGPEELSHDFLWRTARALPAKGMIGVFNRSYYEEVLVTRVFPELLHDQHILIPQNLDDLWKWRVEAIRAHERHLAQSGTIVMKFFLHVSKMEQARRLADRLTNPDKQHKFSKRDLLERAHRPYYMDAYQFAITNTSRDWAPWYVIPADDKPFMRLTVANLIKERLAMLDLRFPTVENGEQVDFDQMHKYLVGETAMHQGLTITSLIEKGLKQK